MKSTTKTTTQTINTSRLTLSTRDSESSVITVHRFNSMSALNERDMERATLIYSGVYAPHANAALKTGERVECTTRLNVSLPSDVLAELDDLASKITGGNRSKMIAYLVGQLSAKLRSKC